MAEPHASKRPLRDLWRCDAGVSAIELAIIAPMLIAGLLTMIDLGLAAGMRMEMDRNVRAGAQAAMSLNNSLASIADIVTASAEEAAGLGVSVNLVCSCAGVDAGCTTPCATGEAPSIFVDLTATRDYAGIVISHMQLEARNRVQIR